MTSYYHPYEARSWLSARDQRQSFALNHFDDNEHVLDFVEDLYDLGAMRITVEANDADPTVREGFGTAANMDVVLPQAEAAATNVREQIIVRAAKEHPDVIEVRGNVLHLWWD